MSTAWILWGSHPRYADGLAIRLTGGTLPECRRELRWRKADGGWADLVIRKEGSPANLLLPVSA